MRSTKPAKADPEKLTPSQRWALERFKTGGSIARCGVRYDVGSRLFNAGLIERDDGNAAAGFGYYAQMRVTEAGRNALQRSESKERPD